MKKIISFIIALVMVLGLAQYLPESIAYASSDSNLIYGECGDNIVWNINPETETLTISGNGKMIFDVVQNYGPWVRYRSEFRYVVIEEGIINIPTDAFTGCVITKLYMPASVEVIESGALKDFVGNIIEIEIAENSRLRRFELDSNLKSTTWYKNLPGGPVYIGRMLLTYNGTVRKGQTVEIKDGTYAINRDAFANQSNLENIIIPDSVERIGKNAFNGTAWYNNQPDGVVYAGNVLYTVKNAVSSTDTSIKDGTVSVAEYAFYNYKYSMKDYRIPASVKYIDDYSYAYMSSYVWDLTFESGSRLKEISEGAFCESVLNYDTPEILLPDSLEIIGDGAFYSCIFGSSDDIATIEIPANLKRLGECVFEASSVEMYTVDENNEYFKADEAGVLYNKDMTTLVVAPTCFMFEEYSVPDTVTRIEISAFSSVETRIKKLVLPDSLKEIGAFAFYNSHVIEMNLPYGIKTIEPYTFALSWLGAPNFFYIPKSVESIKTKAFYNVSSGMRKYVIPESVKYIASDAFYGMSIDARFYCFENSAAESYAKNNQIPYVIYEEPDITELEALIDDYHEIDRTLYTDESLGNLDTVVESVDLVTVYYTEEQVGKWTEDITTAFENLEPLPADRSMLEAAMENAQSIDRSLYTQESLEKLDELLAEADENFSVLNQNRADELAYKINEAVLSLEYLPADYTKVNEAIAEAEKLDRLLYSNATLSILDQSIDAVDYTLNVTQQNIVDGFADRINTAVSSLAYAEVVLHNEPNGVIVSATAKEIYPTTELTVDILDASAFEGANFAIGGHIRSVQYYDINLIRGGEKTQPDGKVTVKVRIPDGVSPENCRVYHVTDDPVDPLVRFASTLAGNYIVFETDHFSEFAVIEVETYLSGVSVTDLPAKLTYNINEDIDLTGIEVSAIFSDGTSQTITEYDVSDVDTSSVGTKTVTVYYTVNGITKSASFDITVTEDVSAEIRIDGEAVDEYNRKVRWYMGYSSESVQLECDLYDADNYNVEWSSDNDKVLVDENGKVTNKGFFFARSATITVTVKDSAGNVLATDEITVRFYKFSFQLTRMQTAAIIRSKKENETGLNDAD